MIHPKFGKAPSGERLALVQRSPNYKDGKFVNFSHTPEITEGYTDSQVIWEFLFKKSARRRPAAALPSTKTDLLHLSPGEDVLVWFGHSSYFMQIGGRRILVDPVFSGNASPIPRTVRSFRGTERYGVDDLPPIDHLFISHDHYDHVDYETIIKLRSKTAMVICGLGVEAHFEYWGYDKNKIVERDWHQKIDLGDGFVVHTLPARHFSGRGLSRNNTLWLSFLLQTPTLKIFIGGDSGYDTHFAAIGKQFGPIDLAILDNGQYDPKWRYIHTHPPEVLQAARDLAAKRLFPVHSSKFSLGNHAWDEPLQRVSDLNRASPNPIPLVTPIIGSSVFLKDERQVFTEWWKGIQ
jgi:L-ascorbate metabolism protein UlaG (beta-lactamase superfamily)